MAKHRRSRRSRKSYGDLVSLPDFGDLPLVNDNVKGMDVFVGAGVGVIVGAVVRGLLKKFAPTAVSSIDSTLGANATPLFGASAAAALLYFAQKKGNPGRASGMAVGALTYGLGMAIYGFAKNALGANALLDFSALTELNLGNYSGLLINDNNGPGVNGYQNYGRYDGLLINDNSQFSNMQQLAAMSMGDDDGGVDQLAGY